jgi:hypothetical protein
MGLLSYSLENCCTHDIPKTPHCKKKVIDFPVPSREVTPWTGIIVLFPYSDLPAGDGENQ